MTSKAVVIRQQLKALEPEFAPLLPKNVSPKQFTRVVMTAIQGNPELLNADQQSLFSSCMKAAEDGLVPDGREAALVTFGGKVQYMRMVSGLVEKLYRTGMVHNVETRKVLEGDDFVWIQGTDEEIRHQRKLGHSSNAIVAVYTVIELTNGAKSFHVMEADEINAIRDKYARSPEKGPWKDRWEAMAYKTCLRQHCKTKPMQAQFGALFEDHDQMFDVGHSKVVATGSTGTAAALDVLEGESGNAGA